MKITLRKANAVQNTISDTIKQIKIDTTVSINEFENAEAKLASANAKLFENDQRRSDLLMSQYAIRGLVGVANATSGVDAKLTQAAYIEKRISQLTEIAGSEVQAELTVINGKLEKIRNRKEDSRASLYGRDDEVTTHVQTQEQVTEAKNLIKDLKKQKQQLNDEVLELNVRTEITLPDDVVGILKCENIV
jgi:hypothetical protein